MEDNNIRYVDTVEFFTLMLDYRTIRTSLKTIKMHGITYKVDIPPEECNMNKQLYEALKGIVDQAVFNILVDVYADIANDACEREMYEIFMQQRERADHHNANTAPLDGQNELRHYHASYKIDD